MTPERLNRSGTEFTEQKMLRLDSIDFVVTIRDKDDPIW